MWKWALLLLLAGAAWPAMAKTMSIEQVEQYLLKLHGQPDAKVAQEIGDVEITERVSTARLARWKTDLPGEHTREALMKLADETAFLNPPMSDVLHDPAPDEETQEKMLALASEYVNTTMTRMPNFYATRLTTHFEDMPSLQHMEWAQSGLALNAAEFLLLSQGQAISLVTLMGRIPEAANPDEGLVRIVATGGVKALARLSDGWLKPERLF